MDCDESIALTEVVAMSSESLLILPNGEDNEILMHAVFICSTLRSTPTAPKNASLQLLFLVH
jgi:hypothetical protein